MVVCLLASVWACSGCSPIEPKPTAKGPKFGVARLTSDAVALEVGLVQLDDSQDQLFEQFWDLLDHQKLDLTFRRRLDENGLRVGVMPSQPPAAFLELVQPRPCDLESLDLVQQQLAQQGKLEAKTRMVVHQRVVNRRGEVYRLESSELHPTASWEIYREGHVVSGSGESVQSVWEISTSPQSDGTARVRLTPRLNFGPVRTTIGVGEQNFAYDSGQSGQLISDLALEVVLRPGETLVLAPTADRSDLGKLCFDSLIPPEDPHRTPSHLTHRFLLVRLVQTQLDDLFGQAISTEPLIQK